MRELTFKFWTVGCPSPFRNLHTELHGPDYTFGPWMTSHDVVEFNRRCHTSSHPMFY